MNDDFEAEFKAYSLIQISYFSRPRYYFVQDPSPYPMSHSQLIYYVSYYLKMEAKENVRTYVLLLQILHLTKTITYRQTRRSRRLTNTHHYRNIN